MNRGTASKISDKMTCSPSLTHLLWKKPVSCYKLRYGQAHMVDAGPLANSQVGPGAGECHSLALGSGHIFKGSSPMRIFKSTEE